MFRYSGVDASTLVDQALAKAKTSGRRQTYRSPFGFKAAKRIGDAKAILNVTAGGPTGTDSQILINLASS